MWILCCVDPRCLSFPSIIPDSQVIASLLNDLPRLYDVPHRSAVAILARGVAVGIGDVVTLVRLCQWPSAESVVFDDCVSAVSYTRAPVSGVHPKTLNHIG